LFFQEEEYNEELQEQLHGQQQEITHRNWDDEFVLKRQFSGKLNNYTKTIKSYLFFSFTSGI
jgi:hypothetical protein